MLYVKQKLTAKKYLIYDSDDDSVEEADYDTLLKCVRDLGMQISGVVHVNGNYLSITTAPIPTKSRKEVKLQMFKDITMRVEDDKLIYLGVDDLKGDVTLNLEGYCTEIADYFMPDRRKLDSGCLHLILPAGIKISPRAFQDYFVLFKDTVDVSALDDKTANLVYRHTMNYHLYFADDDKKVILDSNDFRFYYYVAEQILRSGLDYVASGVKRAEEVIPYVDEYGVRLFNKYEKKFSTLSSGVDTFKFSGRDLSYGLRSSWCDSAKRYLRQGGMYNVDDFVILYRQDRIQAVDIIYRSNRRILSTSLDFIRMCNYYKYFNKTSDAGYLVKYVENMFKFFNSFC